MEWRREKGENNFKINRKIKENSVYICIHQICLHIHLN